ncbi:hypothetical protein LDL48_14915 [Wangella sp. NEAU-J3]|nr:hypothetical protein [Jidongwangia harbinensis]
MQTAHDAAVLEQQQPKPVPDDIPELERVDAETTRLLTESTAAGAPADVVIDRGRRAALRMMDTGASWSSTAAQEALAGDEQALRHWLATGRLTAAEQDDRARVTLLAERSTKQAQRDAALRALAGTHADVVRFLKTQDYPDKAHYDRIAIGDLIRAGGPAMFEAGNKALDGTAADVHEFLRTGQYIAAEHDNNIAVGKIALTGGPEVKAAANIALDGPPSYREAFLKTGQYKAAQRDQTAAVHAATAKRYVADAARSAALAREDAAKAAKLAANAERDAVKADTAAKQAAASAKEASDAAIQANNYQQQANSAADQAAASAKAARDAAAAATAAAAQAQQSADHATFAALRAADQALSAQRSAAIAREAARAAGKDAKAADDAAQEAFDTAVEKKKAEERAASYLYDEKGKFKPPCNPDANPILQPFPCRQSNPFMRHLDEGTGICEDRFGSKQVCDLIDEHQKQKDREVNTRMQTWLTVCGFLSGIGEVCDGIDAAVAAIHGDGKGAATSLAAMIPFGGWGAGGKRLIDLVREAKQQQKKACKANSFVPGTPVLLADGSTKPIEDIHIGDTVLASDPTSNTTAGKPVTDIITGTGVKQLVDITIDVDGSRGSDTATITATHNHPFWVLDLEQWTDAANLQAGRLLLASSGASVAITSIRHRIIDAKVHNLTVADIHTYYVLAGNISVLVHNDNVIPNGTRWTRGDFPVGGAVDAGGPANGVLYRTQNGAVSNYAVYDSDGIIKYRVDLIGASHKGVDTPHYQPYNVNTNPNTGAKYPKPTGDAFRGYGPDGATRLGGC